LQVRKTNRDLVQAFIRDEWSTLIPAFLVIVFLLWVSVMRGTDFTIVKEAAYFGLATSGLFMIWKFLRFQARYRRLERMCNEPAQTPSIENAKSTEQLLLTALEAKDELNRMTQEGARAQVQDLQDFYAMWSHEIKVPLSVLNLMAQTDQLEQKAVQDELLKIDQNMDMMLSYVRLNQTGTDLVLEPVNLKAIVTETIKKYRRFFITKGLSVSLDDLAGTHISDEKWLSFVLDQVIFNAVKYTPAGGLTISFGNGRLTIADTGMGIDPQDLPRIFERGYTGYNGRMDKKASGLGLYLVKQTLDKLGNSIQIDSELGVGTTVAIDFTQTFQ
jgi:signal transduction histidine kinase